MADIQFRKLYLKPHEDARLRQGHVWVFSNEVDVKRSPLDGFVPGEPCLVVTSRDQALGTGYMNPNALICARLLTRGTQYAWGRSLIAHRLNVALGLRKRLYTEPYYRLVFGESDALPGLVLDRYNDVIVGQIATAGMERLKDDITEVVVDLLKPSALVWKNDGNSRTMEQLPDYADVGFGTLSTPVKVHEGGLGFMIDPIGGQKTGWFYDQRANRDQLAPFVKGKRVLDVFSYLGAWGLRAAAFGASEVVCVDASASAVEAITRNAALNGYADRVRAVKADAFEELKRLCEMDERFDVVILDPPAFVKRKKDFIEGRLAYRRINELAIRLLQKDGILVSCSCSYHLPRSALLETLQQSARHLDRSMQVLVQLQQGPDHPVHPAVPETDYLKGFICRVLPS